MGNRFIVRIGRRKGGKKFLHQHFKNFTSTLRCQERQKQQGSHCFMHHVRRRPISNIFADQLDLPEDRNQETVRIHERRVPRHHGDGMQRLPEDLKKYMRPIHHPTTKRARTLHQVNHPPNPRINKETAPLNPSIRLLLSRGPLDFWRTEQLIPIRIHQVNLRVLSL